MLFSLNNTLNGRGYVPLPKHDKMNLKEFTSLNKETILSLISSKDIFTKYFGEFELYRSYRNPLRKDEQPSSKFFVTDEEDLLFYDFPKGKTYNCFSFVMEKFKIEYWEALKKIKDDFELDLTNQYVPSTIRKDKLEIKKRKKPRIQVTKREWENYDLDYWKSYGVSESTLNKFGVIPVIRVYLNKKLLMRSTKNNPIYAYQIKDKLKIYRPKAAKIDKWLGSVDKTYFHNFDGLGFLDRECIITSSLKDLMCLHDLGYKNVICPQAETINLPKKMIDSIRLSFKYVYIFYDNDNTGNEYAQKWADKYNLIKINTPDKTEKDISDYYKTYGKKLTSDLVKKLLTKIDNNDKSSETSEV